MTPERYTEQELAALAAQARKDSRFPRGLLIAVLLASFSLFGVGCFL